MPQQGHTETPQDAGPRGLEPDTHDSNSFTLLCFCGTGEVNMKIYYNIYIVWLTPEGFIVLNKWSSIATIGPR